MATDFAKSDTPGARSRFPRNRVVWLGLGALLLLALGTGAYFTFWPDPPELPPLPDPNGYDDLIEAAFMIRGGPSASLFEQDVAVDELRAFVEPNRDVLALARSGLDKPTGVWLSFNRNNMPHISRIGALRDLGRLLSIEAKLAEAEGDTSAALASHVDTVRLGHAISKGGLMLDSMTGIAIEDMGRKGLTELRSKLKSGECRGLILQLKQIDENRQPFQAMLDNEAIWRQRAVPVYERLILSISGAGRDLLQPAIDQADQADKRSQCRLRMLMLALATQVYHDNKHTYPGDLSELAPDYLPESLVDPFSGKGFLCRQQGEAFLVYSVSHDGEDNHGNPLGSDDWDTPGRDLVIRCIADEAASDSP